MYDQQEEKWHYKKLWVQNISWRTGGLMVNNPPWIIKVWQKKSCFQTHIRAGPYQNLEGRWKSRKQRGCDWDSAWSLIKHRRCRSLQRNKDTGSRALPLHGSLVFFWLQSMRRTNCRHKNRGRLNDMIWLYSCVRRRSPRRPESHLVCVRQKDRGGLCKVFIRQMLHAVIPNKRKRKTRYYLCLHLQNDGGTFLKGKQNNLSAVVKLLVTLAWSNPY